MRTQAALSLAPESAVGYPPIVAEFLPQAVLFVKNYKSKETYTNVAEGFEDLTLVGALQVSVLPLYSLNPWAPLVSHGHVDAF